MRAYYISRRGERERYVYGYYLYSYDSVARLSPQLVPAPSDIVSVAPRGKSVESTLVATLALIARYAGDLHKPENCRLYGHLPL
jgi:hypothetical protein